MSNSLIGKIAKRAVDSRIYLFLLNRIMSYAVPFNSPHRIRIEKIGPGHATVCLPFIRRNRNHVNSVHACALATLCEFTSGIAVMTLLPAERYRIVLKSLNMDYHYRAKGDVLCQHQMDGADFMRVHQLQLESGAPVIYETCADVFDRQGNLICTGKATWQIKSWQSVKSN